ncbi:MAG: hypothetical protein H0W34_14080 [Pyrinomonadaceae bacterium]|nr:hypothetical protein [Pyrinomonadaceae bacterium]
MSESLYVCVAGPVCRRSKRRQRRARVHITYKTHSAKLFNESGWPWVNGGGGGNQTFVNVSIPCAGDYMGLQEIKVELS